MKTVVKIPEAGDIVVCPNGHRVCQCKEDVVSGAVCDPNQFEWFQNALAHGGHMMCEECGERYDVGVNGIVVGFLIEAPQ